MWEIKIEKKLIKDGSLQEKNIDEFIKFYKIQEYLNEKIRQRWISKEEAKMLWPNGDEN